MSYTFSKHSINRFCERVMGYDNQVDIAVFISSHNDDIQDRISKLIEYSDLIYEGASASEYNKQPVKVFLNKSGWIVIVDAKKDNIITIYNITLGLDSELDKQYLEKVSEKINELKEKEEIAMIGINSQEETYASILAENALMENELRSQLNALESQDKAYKEVIDSLNSNKDLAQKERRDFVAKLLGRKVF